MKRAVTICALSTLLIAGAFAQEIRYDAASIPANLRENAHVIKRYEKITFDVKDVDRAVLSVHRVLTVLDEKGAWALNFTEYTNKLRKIDEFEVKGYNALGMVVEKFRKKDLQKQAILDGLVTDGMYHYIRIKSTVYPATIEYKYEVEYTGTASYPAWQLQVPDQSVEFSSFAAKVPVDLDLRFRSQQIDIKPKVSTEGKQKVYQWEAKNVLSFGDEENTADWSSCFPGVILAPNKFRHYNTFGEMTTWKAFGKWAYDLMAGLDELPAGRNAFFVALVKDAGSDREKVAKLYDYLQKNFRYVSIQLGIGGVKPFPAQFTDEKKYGDCKALSFFMHTALKAVGIKSYCALINAGYNSNPVPADFPSDPFDHEILCVPLQQDTIWLECTSNTTEFGQLGTFTENRNALLLTENGGVLVRTPRSSSGYNTYITTTNVLLAEDGSGTSTTSTASNGAYRETLNSIMSMKKDDQKISIVNHLGFRNPDDFLITRKAQDAFLNVDIELSIEKIPQFKAGNKMFLNKRLNNLWAAKLPKAEGRRHDFYFRHPFIKIDTTVYHLPEGFAPEAIPEPVDVKCEYGSYRTAYVFDETKKQVRCIARLELLQHKIPAAQYAAVKYFFDRVMSDEAQKLVVKRD